SGPIDPSLDFVTRNRLRGAIQATVGMLLVGSLVAVNAAINDYPIYTAHAIRYTLAAIALGVVLAVRRPPPVRLTRRDVVLLVTLSVAGLAVFNVAIAQATHHASSALVGTIVGSGPIVMAILGP